MIEADIKADIEELKREIGPDDVVAGLCVGAFAVAWVLAWFL